MWTVLQQYQKEHLDQFRGRSDCWLNLEATPTNVYGLVKFNADELIFLLQSDEAQLFSNVMLEEQRFHIVMQLIEKRTSLKLDQAMPRIEAAGIGDGQPLKPGDAEKILGVRISTQLKSYTEHIVEHVDKDVLSLESTCNELREAMIRLYPKHKPLTVIFSSNLQSGPESGPLPQ